MVNYIATEHMSSIIEGICKKQNILILYETKDIININTYLKETKVNFNLIKYFIIEISCLDNSEKEIIENICKFKRLHSKIRIVILAQGFSNQSDLLNQLYNNEIYNIVNSENESEIEQQLTKCLSNAGIQKNEAKKFEKIQELEVKNKSIIKHKQNLDSTKKKTSKKEQTRIEHINQVMHQPVGVYFFAVLLEAITRLVRLICYILVFLLTSIGITILMNPQLRDLVFQTIGFK